MDSKCSLSADPATGVTPAHPITGGDPIAQWWLGGSDPDLRHGLSIGINRNTKSWNVAGATFAYAYGLLAELDYAYVGMDQLIGTPRAVETS